MNITVYLGANQGNDPALLDAVMSRVMRKIDSTSGRNLLQWGG